MTDYRKAVLRLWVPLALVIGCKSEPEYPPPKEFLTPPFRLVNRVDSTHVMTTAKTRIERPVMREGFENGRKAWRIVPAPGAPAEAAKTQAGVEPAEVVVGRGPSHHGNASARIGMPEAEPRHWPRLERTVRAKPQTTYVVTAWVRAVELEPQREQGAGAGIIISERVRDPKHPRNLRKQKGKRGRAQNKAKPGSKARSRPQPTERASAAESRAGVAAPTGTPEVAATAAGPEKAPVAAEPAGVSKPQPESQPQTKVIVHRHLPRERGTTQDWRKIEYEFTTAAATDQLKIELVAASGLARGMAYFDDIRLVELTEFGQYLRRPPYESMSRNIPEFERVKEFTIDNDTRPGLLAPIPTIWRVGIVPTDDTELLFAMAQTPQRRPSGREACFTVTWLGTSKQVLFQRCGRLASFRGWEGARVNLGEYVGQKGEVRFATTWGETWSDAPAQGGHVVWGNPRFTTGTETTRPDVIFLVHDTLRADRLGFEGFKERDLSPTMNRLAARSVRFSRAYTSSPWTTTSLASLMTGQTPSENGGGLRFQHEEHTTDRFLNFQKVGSPYLPEILQREGYETVAFHSNVLFGAPMGFARGYDRFRDYKGGHLGAKRGVVEIKKWLTGRGKRSNRQPLFLVTHFADPHLPYRLRGNASATVGPLPEGDVLRTKPGVKYFQNSKKDWEKVRELDQMDRVLRIYENEIAHVDRALRELLKAKLIRRDSIVVMLSDHGEAFDEHGILTHGNGMYDELIRIPLTIRLPKDARAGEVIDKPVSIFDVAPTVLTLLGIPVPAQMSGLDLLGKPLPEDRLLISEGMFYGPDMTAAIVGNHKLIWTHPKGYFGAQGMTGEYYADWRGWQELPMHTGRALLFDLKADPQEKTDQARRKPKVVAELTQKIIGYLQTHVRGLHLRCAGSSKLGFTLEANATVQDIQPYTMEPTDRVMVQKTRRSVSFTLGGSGRDEDSLLVRFFDRNPEFELTPQDELAFFTGSNSKPLAAGTQLKLNHNVLKGTPSQIPKDAKAWCQIWSVSDPRPGADLVMSEKATEELKALGYMGP